MVSSSLFELISKHTGYVFYFGLFCCAIMFLPMFICMIINVIYRKKLPKILLKFGYEELSLKIIQANEYKGGNDPKSKEWKNSLLHYKEFRNIIIPKDYKTLKHIQNFEKFFFIFMICFFISLLIGGWGMGVSSLLATLMAIMINENIITILRLVLYTTLPISVCTILTRFLLLVIRKY